MRPTDESARSAPVTTASLRVVPYDSRRPEHRIAFRALNLAWIEAHFVVEERDRHELGDPEGSILTPGGHIFMAEVVGPAAMDIVGTCALLAGHDGIFELAKMAVDPTARGHGIGRALGAAAIDKARALGARRVELLSNTVLRPAIALYQALGFVEAPLPATDYARANIRMILDLPAVEE
jgi:GNAT superfamily N-acetyltransferase